MTDNSNRLAELGWSNHFAAQLGAGELETHVPARVLAVHRNSLDVAGPDFEGRVLPLAAEGDEDRATVGDFVLIDAETRRPPELPRYDHDDLAGCFYRIKKHIDALLDVVVEPDDKERPFVGAGYRMLIQELETAWLDSNWEMYIGVQSPLERSQCVDLLTDSSQLDMKVGGARRVEMIYRQRFPGLHFTHEPNPTQSLPKRPGLIYFQVDRESEPEEWRHVVESQSLAIRVNDRFIIGDIQDQTSLAIRLAGGQEIVGRRYGRVR